MLSMTNCSNLATVSLRTLAVSFKSTETLPSDGENIKYSAKHEILRRCCENSSLLKFYAVQIGNIAVVFRFEKPKKTD